MSKAKSKPREDPITPGHAAYFSPAGTGDPLTNRVTGMVRIIDWIDDDPESSIFRIRNVDNNYECIAFADELEEPW